jgi:hypothetical protein
MKIFGEKTFKCKNLNNYNKKKSNLSAQLIMSIKVSQQSILNLAFKNANNSERGLKRINRSFNHTKGLFSWILI